MCKILNDYKDDIERYCAENGLSSRKVFQAPKSFNNEMVFLQFHDPAKGRLRDAGRYPGPCDTTNIQNRDWTAL